MAIPNEALGGRLPLLSPSALSAAQQPLYDRIMKTAVPWANAAHFESATPDGQLIGPFNVILYSPEVTARLMDLQDAESKYTTLSQRVRQVIILSVGAVWQTAYELYAHEAVARQAGLSEQAIRALAAGELPTDLSAEEVLAHRYARALSLQHRVEAGLYQEAEAAFTRQGLVDLTLLVGIYHTVCALLNGFEVPKPA